MRPERAKALIDLRNVVGLLPLQGAVFRLSGDLGRCPGLGAFAPLGRAAPTTAIFSDGEKISSSSWWHVFLN